MDTKIPAFGERKPGVEYKIRPGGYLIIFNNEGKIAVVRSEKGSYLPGGGLEKGESPEEAAIREALEECAMKVRVLNEIGTADEYVYAAEQDEYLRKRGTFFLAAPVSIDGEGDHELLWLSREDALRDLKHESQKWAVQLADASVTRPSDHKD